MPCKPRSYLSGIPAHVVQRGNNRNACFFTNEDYRFYLECLGEGLRRHAVRLHAYDATGISRLLQHVGRLYVLYINKTYRRSGTL